MSTISDLGNGVGYLYITESNGSTPVGPAIINDVSGKQVILHDGLTGAPVAGSITAVGTLTLSGTPANLTALTVNGVSVISGTVAAAGTLALTADAIRNDINTYIGTPKYHAQSSGATVFIFPNPGTGSAVNGFAVAAAAAAGMTVTTTDLAGGTDVNTVYDNSTGHRYFINANSNAPVGSLVGATEITQYILTRGVQSSQYSTTATIGAGVISPVRIVKDVDVLVDTEGGAGSDDLNTILTSTYNDYDTLIIRGANPAHVVTVKNYVGGGDNIYLANGLDWSSGGYENVLSLTKIGLNWYENYRAPGIATTVSSLRAAGIAAPVQGVDAVTLPTNGTVNIEPGVDKGYYVVTGSPVLIGSVVYQIQPSPATPYLDGDEVTVNYTATATPGVNNVTIFGITLTADQVALGNVVVTTKYDLSNTTWYSSLVTKTNGRDVADLTQLATKEDYLGVPAIDGSVLASLANGTRYWTSPSSTPASVEYSLTSADILSLNTNPFQLIAAPGAGYYIDVITVTLNYTFNTTPYATNTTLLFYEVSTVDGVYAFDTALASTTSYIKSSNNVDVFNETKTHGSFAENMPFMITTLIGDPTAGDGTLKVNVLYRVVAV